MSLQLVFFKIKKRYSFLGIFVFLSIFFIFKVRTCVCLCVEILIYEKDKTVLSIYIAVFRTGYFLGKKKLILIDAVLCDYRDIFRVYRVSFWKCPT